jgi:hypothetical protein
LRWNDAKVSPDGALFLGSMAYDNQSNEGAFYRLSKDGKKLDRLFGEVGISNGMDWSVDKTKMFYIDTLAMKVDLFDYNNGQISNRRTLVEITDGIQKIKIIIAGKCDRKTLHDIKQFQKLSNKFNFEIIIFNYFIDENFQNILFSASNLVWIGYTRYYSSSGVYYLAGHMKRPVIINNKGTLYNLNKKYKIGVATDVTDPKKVCDSINFIMISESRYYKNNFKQFININKKNVFSKQIIDKILLS